MIEKDQKPKELQFYYSCENAEFGQKLSIWSKQKQRKICPLSSAQ